MVVKALKEHSISIVAIIIVLALLFTSIYVLFFSSVWVEGTVDHKILAGTKGDATYTLVMVTPYGLDIDPSVSDLFNASMTNLTITPEIEQELQSRGYQLYYVANIRARSHDPVNGLYPGQTEGLFTSKEIFNRLSISEDIEYQVSYFHSNWVTGMR